MLVLVQTLNALVSVVVNTDDISEMTLMRDRTAGKWSQEDR